MLSYYLKCRKNTECKNWRVVKRKNGRVMVLSKCVTCYSTKLGFIKEKEAKRLLSTLRKRKIFSQTTIVDPILF